jgi:hypothetical protein
MEKLNLHALCRKGQESIQPSKKGNAQQANPKKKDINLLKNEITEVK